MALDDLSLTQQQVVAAQGGDREALEQLFVRYLPRVRRIVASRLGRTVRNLDDCDDVVQETLASAFRAVERFDYKSPGAFCNWLAQCVENKVIDRARRAGAQKRGGGAEARFADLDESLLADSIFAGDEATPSQNLAAGELEGRLERALLELNPRHREVINLRVYCELSFAEIANAMELRSENTANVLFLRARHKLQKLLG